MDQALTLYEVLLERKQKKKTTFLCFVDFRKAFDTVWHDGLWKRLWDSGIRGKAWRILRKLYSPRAILASTLVSAWGIKPPDK